MLDKSFIIKKEILPWRDISFLIEETALTGCILGGAKGGATVGLYQNGGCDECKVGCFPYSKSPLFSMVFTFLYTVSLI